MPGHLELQGSRASVAVVYGLSRYSSRLLKHRLHSCGSGLGWSTPAGSSSAHRPSPCLQHWQADSLPVSHQGSPPVGLQSRGGRCFLQAGEVGRWGLGNPCVGRFFNLHGLGGLWQAVCGREVRAGKGTDGGDRAEPGWPVSPCSPAQLLPLSNSGKGRSGIEAQLSQQKPEKANHTCALLSSSVKWNNGRHPAASSRSAVGVISVLAAT